MGLGKKTSKTYFGAFIIVSFIFFGQIGRADWFALPSLGGVQASNSSASSNTGVVKKTVSGVSYSWLGGYSAGNAFVAMDIQHGMTSGGGELGDLISFGLDVGVKLGDLFILGGYDYKYQYGADIVATSNGTRSRIGVGYEVTQTLTVRAEVGFGTMSNAGGAKLDPKQPLNTVAVFVGVPFGSF